MSFRQRIGVDTGGTFTDLLAACPDGGLAAVKLPSTPADPARAVLDGLGLLRPADPQGDVEVIHGTTVGTNTLLERSGGRTALLTTRGFEDLLILGRQARPQLYALAPAVPLPLCPDECCLGLDERLLPDGQVLRPLRQEELERLCQRLRELDVSSIAVVLLHSYANDAHERAVAQALAPLSLPVSLSSVVLPAHREYERAQATVVDAYVAPVVGAYLRRLQTALENRGVSRLRVMQSTGGAIAAQEAAAAPVRTVLSGPAAGVVGARLVAAASGVTRCVTFDMGGTSTDVALVDGEPQLTSEMQIAGLPLSLPMLAVHTVGTGGGSMVRVDRGGALQLGPRSAGANPGPACYGRGGLEPTLTDADLLLGRLSAARFCDGALALSSAAAAAALQPIADAVGLPLRAAAAGVVKVACAQVARAVRAVSVEQGLDPGEFTLVAFGGAGGLHAADLAEELGIPRILVPPAPGLLCAYGALSAQGVRERSRTLLWDAAARQQDGSVRAALQDLLGQVAADLEREDRQGAGRGALFEWCAELRYHGQSYELTLAGRGDGGPARGPDTDLALGFRDEHERRYGFTLPERRVELVALRARGVLPVPAIAPQRLARLGGRGGARSSAATLGTGEMSFLDGARLRSLTAPLLDRDALRPGQPVQGPALLCEYSATTVLPPGWRAEVDEHGALRIEI